MEERSFFGGRVSLLSFPAIAEARGTLLPLPFDKLPFAPRRCFCISDVPAGTARGGHAHRTGAQLLLCLGGEIQVLMREGPEEVTVRLEPGGTALLIGAGIWARQTYVTPHAVLLVLASEDYDPASYLPAPAP